MGGEVHHSGCLPIGGSLPNFLIFTSPGSQRQVQVLVAQSCPTLCDLIDCSRPGSSVHGILRPRILEWVASHKVDLPNSGIEPGSPALQTDSFPSEPPGKPHFSSQGFSFVCLFVCFYVPRVSETRRTCEVPAYVSLTGLSFT